MSKKKATTSVILALSNFGIAGCLDPAQYKGAEHKWPHGWKELTDRGISFDQVDVDLPGEDMAEAYLDHFSIKNILKRQNDPMVIRAEVHSDDITFQASFDALPWFEQATDDEIMALVNIDWGGDYAADDVAKFCADLDPEVAKVFDYVERKSGLGFECNVDDGMAMAWLQSHRAKLYKKIREQVG